MSRHRRREFSKQTQRDARDRSGGRCESRLVPFLAKLGIDCRQELTTGNRFYEHVNQDYFCSDNTLDNCACLCRRCYGIKKNQEDIPVIAKNKRVADYDRGVLDPHRKRLPGSKDDPYKMRLNQFRATPVDRRTGDFWRPRR